MPDNDRGFFDKFAVFRTDTGSRVAGPTFTLVVERDPFAAPALRAYADACERVNPALAADLRELAKSAPVTQPS